jgi:hypothetical protein
MPSDPSLTHPPCPLNKGESVLFAVCRLPFWTKLVRSWVEVGISFPETAVKLLLCIEISPFDASKKCVLCALNAVFRVQKIFLCS